jgi:CubicO group peptidase (beta-lactamase class C family)
MSKVIIAIGGGEIRTKGTAPIDREIVRLAKKKKPRLLFIFGPEFNKHRKELRTLNDYVVLYGKRGPQFEPGSQWRYSNYGMLLLGVVIERVTGQSYYDYVQEHIYPTAGMTLTASLPEDQAVAGRSIGYMRSEAGGWVPNADTLPYRGTSAGGGYSTVGDLVKFADALMSHKLLNAASIIPGAPPPQQRAASTTRPRSALLGLSFRLTARKLDHTFARISPALSLRAAYPPPASNYRIGVQAQSRPAANHTKRQSTRRGMT